MVYCIDTSALINLGERNYPEHITVFKPIWEHIYNSIKSGAIVSVDYVQIELENKAAEWRKNFLLQANASAMFHMNESIELEYAGVIHDIEHGAQFLDNLHLKRFMKGADPWLIAQARSIGTDAIVISGEMKKLADYGLGAVCKELGVKHIGLVEFFEDIK